jgi:hypothetical protein
MTADQARALIRAADALPQEIGANLTFSDGYPCCAVGHLAYSAGCRAPRGYGSASLGAGPVMAAYGLHIREVTAIECANDSSPADRRRAAVIAVIEGIIRAHGYDPDALRAEVAGDA